MIFYTNTPFLALALGPVFVVNRNPMSNPTLQLQRGCFVALAILVPLLAGCAHINVAPFSFVQMDDPQIGFTDYRQELARFKQAVTQINELKPAFVVICGDLVNTPNRVSFEDFNRAKARLQVPCYCAPGNHDVGNDPSRLSLKQYRKYEGNDYYSFDRGGCTFLVLNTQLWKSPLPGATEQQDAWLEHSLAKAREKGRPVFVIEHYPPFVKSPNETNAYFNLPPAKRQELLTNFERSGVRAVLAGHTHTTATLNYGQIQVVTSETTSRNFDQRPFGFRVWHVDPNGSFRHEFVPLRDQGAPVE